MREIDVVGAVIINDQHQILGALRSANMSLAGYWEFPGGKIEPGESHQTALVREIKEELSCEIETGDFLADIIHEYPNVKVRLITYKAHIISGVPKAVEHEKLEWIEPSEIKSYRWAPADIPTIELLSRERFVGRGDSTE